MSFPKTSARRHSNEVIVIVVVVVVIVVIVVVIIVIIVDNVWCGDWKDSRKSIFSLHIVTKLLIC